MVVIEKPEGNANSASLEKPEQPTLTKQKKPTTRLDNLAIAREMETSGKDAKTILATGWEKELMVNGDMKYLKEKMVLEGWVIGFYLKFMKILNYTLPILK